jgi:alpha/beta superfamily hydrolase
MDEIITNSQGEKLDYTFHNPDVRSLDLLIIGHGVTGNKDRPFVVELAESVAKEGLAVLRFSFSGNGASGGDFRNSTISKEVEDLKAVITVAVANGYRVSYAGHSMGGAVGVLAASSDERIKHGNLVKKSQMRDVCGKIPVARFHPPINLIFMISGLWPNWQKR